MVPEDPLVGLAIKSSISFSYNFIITRGHQVSQTNFFIYLIYNCERYDILFLNLNCTQTGNVKGDNLFVDEFQAPHVKMHTIKVASREATHMQEFQKPTIFFILMALNNPYQSNI